MGDRQINYTAYQARTQWYMNLWGPPVDVRKTVMEDSRTTLGVMVFPPNDNGRNWWTFATNGMSERRMPCLEKPHGNPAHRLELVAYARDSADWVCSLLIETARYPFENRCGFAIGHTAPVTPRQGNLWSGYVLASPRLEPEEFNPLPIEVDLGDDWIFFAEVIGLKNDELQRAIEVGGLTFTADYLLGGAKGLMIDTDRRSLFSNA